MPRAIRWAEAEEQIEANSLGQARLFNGSPANALGNCGLGDKKDADEEDAGHGEDGAEKGVEKDADKKDLPDCPGEDEEQEEAKADGDPNADGDDPDNNGLHVNPHGRLDEGGGESGGYTPERGSEPREAGPSEGGSVSFTFGDDSEEFA